MTKQEAIIKLNQLLVKHRQTHVIWRDFFERNPDREKEFADGSGSLEDQKDTIVDYDEALEALEVLKPNRKPDGLDAETLREIELHIFQMIIDFTTYAGNAFLADDEEMMNVFKGQHMSLMRLQKWVSEKYLRAIQKEEKEQKAYADHAKEQMAALKDHDHKLFRNVVWGLRTEGWKHKGGSDTYALLDKGTAAIKVFRDAKSHVIKICFSCEPEKVEGDEKEENEKEESPS